MDVARIRADFPILERSFHGKRLVYLDSAATSQKPTAVIDAESNYYRKSNANVHRGVYALSEEATDLFEKSRSRVAQFVGTKDPEEIVFLRGTTEGLNLIAGSFARGLLQKGDRVITTVMEHHSNIVPWQMLQSSMGIDLQFLDIDADGRLKLEELDHLLTPSTRIVTLTHVSNVLGTVNPVQEIAERAHAAGALVVVDAAQSAPHRPINVQALGADLLTFSGHKTLGPTGIGALWGRAELLDRMPPWMGGGEMIREVHTTGVKFRDAPAKFEAGTPNIGGACALAAALDYLERIGWEEIAGHEHDLQRYALAQAEARLGGRITVVGPKDPMHREAVISFSLRGVHPHDVAS
ncbi:MAG: aminotransferase class V-fold PLP-dependent enzyme, partial [Thermoplasmata archaeon]|nr:aminotransferase class V-fold PLP-dependent enzyme [Thermoplasmata archaeon]